MRRTARSLDQTAAPWRRRPYRPLLELLEQRLPPGDAIVAGVLAAGFIPERAVGVAATEGQAAPSGPARWLAEARDAFVLLPGVLDDGADFAPTSPERPTPVVADRWEGEPFALSAVASRPAAADGSLTRAAPDGTAAAVLPVGAASGMVAGLVFAAPAAANYALDQAVAALTFPSVASDEPLLDERAGPRGGGVYARFNLGHPTTGPFPSNWFTVPDESQLTDRRVNLPYPDCKVYISDCINLNSINQLDGFNPQPRLSIPFTGPIEVNSVVSYQTVFVVSLGSTTKEESFMPRGYGVGINQVVWDVETNTLHVESEELLAQHTRFALYVTTGVHDTQGDPVQASPTFLRFLHRGQGAYHDQLLDAMLMAQAYGFEERDIVTASVFTTLSTTSYLEKVRDQIKAETPESADFLLGTKGERTVFNRSQVTGITFNQQVRVNPPEFTQTTLNLALLDLVPGAVGRLAFGKYLSPDYRLPDGSIPTIPTRDGIPAVQAMNDVYFNLVLPSGEMPARGWPVTILGHGAGNHRNSYQLILAASLAERGVASIIINQPGFGYGPLSTLVVNRTAGESVTFLEGGRGRDANGDGMIAFQEGGGSVVRQFTADLMQLVRVLQVGVDVDGDAVVDLNAARISYAGNSLGGINGTQFVAVEPDLRAAVLTVTAGGGAENTGRLSAVNRDGNGTTLAARTPPLLNAPGVTVMDGVAIDAPRFHENLPLRDGVPLAVTLADGTNLVIQSPVINTVPGALAIQTWMEINQWLQGTTATPNYGPYLRRAPLPGVPAKAVIFQFGKGDTNQPNAGTTAILRAGQLADRTLYYRNDLAYAEDPAVPRNSHGMMTNINAANPLVRSVARGAQQQIAAFCANDGTETIHPEPRRFFEVPIQGPLPEGLNYIPDP